MASLTPLCDKGFRAFPPEVREMIFSNHLRNTWCGKTPALIQALRGSELYLEAVDSLAKTNIFPLHKENEWSFGKMGTKSIKRIRSLQITVK